MSEKVFASVWEALEESPEEAEAMKVRMSLALAIRAAVEEWSVSQTVAAKRLGVTQPRLNDLLRGKLARFSLEALMTLANRAGLSVRLEVERAA